MASPKRRVAGNVEGDFYVDDSCIDCGTCRWVAPASFASRGSQSVVVAQPVGDAEVRRALMAQVACPTASIGFTERHDARAARDAFPDPVQGDAPPRVYHCGFHSEASFGAASWLIVREAGNVLVDSPRFSEPLARRLEELGGVATIFLTHRDDVADHARWAERFGASRVLHEDDVTDETRGVEQKLSGDTPLALDDDLLVVPVPGHTRGSACLLFDERYLFTGDHLAFTPRDGGRLYAFRRACWYSWPEQIGSMQRLYDVLYGGERAIALEHVIPGHGRRVRLAPEVMKQQLEACIAWMRDAA